MKARKPKKVHYRLIDPQSAAGEKLYGFLGNLCHQFHGDLADARIALAWATGWKADVDGRFTLGRMKKTTDLDKEVAAYDFILLLNRGFIEDANVSDKQRPWVAGDQPTFTVGSDAGPWTCRSCLGSGVLWR